MCTRYTPVGAHKRALNMGTNIKGGDRFRVGDCWLPFMRGIGISEETVGVLSGRARAVVDWVLYYKRGAD